MADSKEENTVPYTLDFDRPSVFHGTPVKEGRPDVPFVFKDWRDFPVTDALPRPKSGDVPYNVDFDVPKVYKGSGQQNKQQQKTETASKTGNGGGSKGGNTAPSTYARFAEQFTPSAPQQPQSDFSPVTKDWFDQTPQDAVAQDQTVREPHRSLLQALMGWDDVPYGKKWNHYLQHGLVGVSRENVDNITKMAALEGGNGLAVPNTYGQELRAKEQKRRTLMNQWDKLLADWNAGRYAGDEQSLNYFYGVADNLRNELAAEGVNPNTLRPPSINAGGFAQGFQKSLQDDRTKLDWLGGWLESIQQHAAQDPNWLNSNQAQMEFDKLSEYVILNWAQSKGAIADAEKVRAQVEAMPAQDRAVFDKFMRMFFNANTMNQLIDMSYSGDVSAMQTLQTAYDFLGMAERGERFADDKTGLPSDNALKIGNSVMHGLQNVIRNNQNLPIDTTSAVTSYKNAKDAYLNYVMQNANVDRKMVWDSAMDQFGIYNQQYQKKLPKLGLQWGWGYSTPNIDQKFGDYLGQWQNQQQTNQVMRDATFGIGSLPKPQNDPYKTGRGGAGAGAAAADNNSIRPDGVPNNAQLINGKWVWVQNGQFMTR